MQDHRDRAAMNDNFYAIHELLVLRRIGLAGHNNAQGEQSKLNCDDSKDCFVFHANASKISSQE